MDEWTEGGVELEGVRRRLQASKHLLSICSAFIQNVGWLAGTVGLALLIIAFFYPQLAAML